MTEETVTPATEVVVPKRDQVKALLNGTMTREEIAKQLEMSTASVSSQLTYLRWMGNFIMYDEDKKLSLTTEEDYNAWVAAKAAKAGTKKATATAKTPAEQYKALAKQIGVEKKQIASWTAKQAQLVKDLATSPEDAEFIEMKIEADAMVALLGVKIARNERKLNTLPEPVEEVPEETIEEELDEDNGSDAGDDDDII